MKDLILFVGGIRKQTTDALKLIAKEHNITLKPLIIYDSNTKERMHKLNKQSLIDKHQAQELFADFDKPADIAKIINPYRERVCAVTCHFESAVFDFGKIIPHFPHLLSPTQSSLQWCTDKFLMRDLLRVNGSHLVPNYLLVDDSYQDIIDAVEKKIRYPVMVKPVGLDGSLLVTKSDNRVELLHNLSEASSLLGAIYHKEVRKIKPHILIEEYLEGDLFSIDAYVAFDGTVYFCPPIKVITGIRKGYADFFGLVRTTQHNLSQQEIIEANKAVVATVKALGLRSSIAHVELIRSVEGWKIVELAPRVGGYRHDMYWLGYGFNHLGNDILVRMGRQPHISDEIKAHTSVYTIYTKKEGRLVGFRGLEDIKALRTLFSLNICSNPGDILKFASHGGDPSIEIVLSNPDLALIGADMSRVENIEILVE